MDFFDLDNLYVPTSDSHTILAGSTTRDNEAGLIQTQAYRHIVQDSFRTCTLMHGLDDIS